MPADIHRVHTDSRGCSGQQAVTGPRRYRDPCRRPLRPAV